MLKRWALGAPAGLAQMREDIDAVLRNYPAARTPVEVVLTYPGVHALWIHRVSHDLFENDFKLLARVISHANRFLTGIEIHPGANIASGVFIDHGMGVVIGETATIGTGCLIYKGVLLGGTKLDKGTRHPQLGKNVVVGSNACLLGAIEIGDEARVGAGSVVVRSVPEGAHRGRRAGAGRRDSRQPVAHRGGARPRQPARPRERHDPRPRRAERALAGSPACDSSTSSTSRATGKKSWSSERTWWTSTSFRARTSADAGRGARRGRDARRDATRTRNAPHKQRPAVAA